MAWEPDPLWLLIHFKNICCVTFVWFRAASAECFLLQIMTPLFFWNLSRKPMYVAVKCFDRLFTQNKIDLLLNTSVWVWLRKKSTVVCISVIWTGLTVSLLPELQTLAGLDQLKNTHMEFVHLFFPSSQSPGGGLLWVNRPELILMASFDVSRPPQIVEQCLFPQRRPIKSIHSCSTVESVVLVYLINNSWFHYLFIIKSFLG